MKPSELNQAIANAEAFIEAVALPLEISIIGTDSRKGIVNIKLFDQYAWVAMSIPVEEKPAQCKVQECSYGWQDAIVAFREAFFAKSVHGIVKAKISDCGQDIGLLQAFYGELLGKYKTESK